MKIQILLALLLAAASATICTEPQRSFYMSFPTLSKRDALTNLFMTIDKNMTALENNYTDSALSANFRISNLTPQAYYNDHLQKETFVDRLRVNVTMGTIAIGTMFNYTIKYNGRDKIGTAMAKGFLDPSYFTKVLFLSDGAIEWNPDVVPALTFSQFFNVEMSNPKFTEDELSLVNKMLNNQAGNHRIKEEIINQVNNFYGPALKQYLNHEKLVSTNNITYKYNNITLQFDNFAKEFEISNDNTKGLEVFFIFGLDSSTENCTVLPKEFDEKEYGGFQEFYTFSTVRAMFKEALNKGLFDVNLDKSWEVPEFQFYMGDLGNSVPFATTFPANDRFDVKCRFNATRSTNELKISRYEEHDIYLSVPETCTVSYAGKDILLINFDIILTVRLSGTGESIRVVVLSAGIYGDTYTSLDAKYKVESMYLAKYSMTAVVNGLVGKTTFGNGFPTVMRRYPVIRIFDDRIVLFDPSEV